MRMFYQLLLTLIGGLSIFSAGYVLYTLIVCRLALWKFQKVSRGLPMPDEISIFDNGARLWGMRKGLNAHILKKNHELPGKTYGSLYGTIPVAMTKDFDVIKRIRAEPQKHINRMPTLNLPIDEVERSIFMAKNEDWRQIRNCFAPALKSNKYMKPNMVSEVDGSIGKLIRLIDSKLADKSKLSADGGRQIELDDVLHRFTLDSFFNCLYKQDNQINFDERPCEWSKMTHDGIQEIQDNWAIRACVIFPILVPLVEWLMWNFHSQGVWRRKILRFIQKQTRLSMEARKEAHELTAKGCDFDPDNFSLKNGTHFRRNMLDDVIDNFLEGKLTHPQYFNTSFFLLNAGNKTTCDALVTLLYYISVHPKVQQRLRESIKERGVASEYLAWVIYESMRLMPPVGSGAARSLGEDMEIENGRYVLPKGTFVVMPTFVIHRLTEYWGEDAEEFKPERWQDTSKHDPCQYMPFGAGHRACPGKDLALFMIKKVIVALLKRYEFHAEIKDDLYYFDSPFFFVQIPNSPTYVTVHKLAE